MPHAPVSARALILAPAAIAAAPWAQNQDAGKDDKQAEDQGSCARSDPRAPQFQGQALGPIAKAPFARRAIAVPTS